MRSARDEFWAGVRAQLPILLGTTPFGLIFGVLALEAGLTPLASFSMSWIVFAGSAQFIGASLFAGGSSALVLILTTFVVNLRHMLYSASLAPHVKHLPAGWKWLLAYLLTDEAYATSITRYQESLERPEAEANRHWFFLGAGLTLWSSWQIATALGVWVGAQAPAGLGLDFTLALTFVALLIPALNDRPALGAALVAALISVLLKNLLPYNLGLIAAVAAGIIAGLVFEQLFPQKPEEIKV